MANESADNPIYTCIGKGGRYELLGESWGVGTSRGSMLLVYRDMETGKLYHRRESDFHNRMQLSDPVVGDGKVPFEEYARGQWWIGELARVTSLARPHADAVRAVQVAINFVDAAFQEVARLRDEVSRLTAERDTAIKASTLGADNLNKTLETADGLRAELTKARELLNTPHTDDWFEGVRLEAGHQIGRWGTDHDAGKAPADWFWLIGYLAQKAMTAQMSGDEEKARHHTISTGAAMLNWFRAIVGDSNAMRPGIDAHQSAPAAKGDRYDKAEDQLHLIAFVKLEDQEYVYRHPQRPVVLPEPVSKYDEVLKPFVMLMERELHVNSGKGDRPAWLKMTTDEAMLEIYYHAAKLQKALKDGDGDRIKEYAADVANLSMMVADICGILDLVSREQQNVTE